MFMHGDPLFTQPLKPQPPLPPEIEGYLKKLKRKTSNLTGSWNKRWFFVDPKRLEFGYAANKTPNAPRSSIYLNDITAVVQFDDTHFQVESRTRNFFLCGESKASTTCWVKSLDEYRKKLAEYEKEVHKLKVTEVSKPVVEPNTSNQLRAGGAIQSQKKPSTHENPARDSLQESSSSASLSIASSSSNLAEEKVSRHINVTREEKRTPSPIDSSRRRGNRESKSRGTAGANDGAREDEKEREPDNKNRILERGQEGERGRRSRDSERERDRSSRERVKDREVDEDRSSKPSSAHRRAYPTGGIATGPSSSHGSGGRAGSRTNSGKSSYTGHPTNGYIMHAWTDEYE